MATKRGFLQGIIRGRRDRKEDAENAVARTRAQKRCRPDAAAGAAVADAESRPRRALNSLSNVQLAPAAKRRSVAKATAPAPKQRRTRRSRQDSLKLSQESNIGLNQLFGSQQQQQQQQQQLSEADVASCKRLHSQDSVLQYLATAPRAAYLDHYPYVLESFFLEQDQEEAYGRELPLLDFLSETRLQPELRPHMLPVLFDWLVEAHESFEMNYETLYTAAKLVYLYLSREEVQRKNLQLVATSALWIASKKEERYPLTLSKLVYICGNAYSEAQFCRMEIRIMKAVQFRINCPIGYNFLRRYLRVLEHTNQTMSYLARYLLELSLLSHELNLSCESLKAASAVWLARAMLGLRPCWPQHVAYTTAWSEADILPVARQMNELALGAHDMKHKITYQKYSSDIFCEVACTPALPANSPLLLGQEQQEEKEQTATE